MSSQQLLAPVDWKALEGEVHKAKYGLRAAIVEGGVLDIRAGYHEVYHHALHLQSVKDPVHQWTGTEVKAHYTSLAAGMEPAARRLAFFRKAQTPFNFNATQKILAGLAEGLAQPGAGAARQRAEPPGQRGGWSSR
eukprot:gene464-7040_t